MSSNMETMTANYTHPPSTSHLAQSPRAQQQQATRAVQPSDGHSQQPHQPTLSQPASQESIVSVQSSYGSSVSKLQGSDSNLSQFTTHTDLTSPSSSAKQPNAIAISADAIQQPTNNGQVHRNRTPENAQYSPTLPADSALYSPMSITSPVVTNSSKRTASGHVKNAHSITNSPYNAQFPGRESRRESLSSSGSKAGEIAATLKARLGYAMAKVQHGWEHKSLAEVEQLAAERQQKRSQWETQQQQQRPGTSGLTSDVSRLSTYDQYGRPTLDINGPPPSKRSSGNYSHYQAQLQHQQQQYATAPRLQPAPDIRPTSSQREAYTGPVFHPVPQHVSNAMSPPRTPVNVLPPHRPASIRTQTQTAEDEREALQALFQLGSPHTAVGPHIARTGTATTNSSQGQMSPNKTDFAHRHVTFTRSESASTNSSGIDTNGQPLHETRTRLVEQLADQ